MSVKTCGAFGKPHGLNKEHRRDFAENTGEIRTAHGDHGETFPGENTENRGKHFQREHRKQGGFFP
jgi:hypothetical protein